MPSDEEQKLVKRKADAVISLLEDVKDLRMKAYVLWTLMQSFKDVSGIDLCKTFYIEESK